MAMAREAGLITYPRAEARYLTENQIGDVPIVASALTRLRGFADLDVRPARDTPRASRDISVKSLCGILHSLVFYELRRNGHRDIHGPGL